MQVEDAAIATYGSERATQFVDASFDTRMVKLFHDRLDQAPESFRPELHRAGLFDLFFHPTILDIVAHIVGTEELRLYPNYTSRPKVPGRSKDQVRWHQDAGYTVSSEFVGSGATNAETTAVRVGNYSLADVDYMAASMVNVWTSLVPVGRNEGCMQFSAGSHHLGLLPHAKPPPDDPWLRLPEEVIASYCSEESGRLVDVDTQPGDIVLFHQYLIHGSQLPNLSGKLRWALDFRFQNADVETLRNTQGHLARSVRQPDSVVKDAEEWASLTLS